MKEGSLRYGKSEDMIGDIGSELGPMNGRLKIERRRLSMLFSNSSRRNIGAIVDWGHINTA